MLSAGEVNTVAPEAVLGMGEAAAWDAALLALDGHVLQSWRWGEFKRRQGWDVERVRVTTLGGGAMAQVLVRARGPVSIAYVPRGPVFAGDAPSVAPRFFAALDDVARRHRALSLILEPNARLPLPGTAKTYGFVRGPEHVQPSRTVKVHLTDDDAMLAQMHPKTRYNVRLAQRRGVRILRPHRDETTLTTFYALLEDTSRRNEFGIHSRRYYDDFVRMLGDDCLLLFALVDGLPAAGLIAARFGAEAIYMYGGSSTEHRAHGAAFYLQFAAMQWARDGGCRTYDLWGIPPRDPVSIEGDGNRVAGTHGDDWRGLYKFKTGFGGDVVTYPATLERRYYPVLSWLARRAYNARG